MQPVPGSWDPHYLTGLAAALWVVNHYWNQPPIAINAPAQYVDFLSPYDLLSEPAVNDFGRVRLPLGNLPHWRNLL
jgi:hypothetical protein